MRRPVHTAAVAVLLPLLLACGGRGAYIAETHRRDELLMAALTNGPSLELYEETIAASPDLAAGTPTTLRLGPDTYYTCAAELPAGAAGLGAAGTGDASAEDANRRDAGALLRKLEDSCMLLLESWWSYELCHRKEVRQFHSLVKNARPVRDPNWSLGVYNHTVVRREGGDNANTSMPVVEVVDHYVGGQHCDETDSPRSTAVHLRCCHGAQSQESEVRVVRSDGGRQKDSAPDLVKVVSIAEPSICSYKMTVCVEPLCNAASSRNVSLSRIMSDLNHTCLTRSEDWWSYELCLGSGVRQFHADSLADAKGKIRTIVKEEFDLGRANPSLYTSEAALRAQVRPPSSSLVARASRGARLALEFVNGTVCDVQPDKRRSSTVEISCGPRDSLVDITEVETCHYKIQMTSTSLCSHSDFTKVQKPSRRVACAREPPAASP